MPPTVRSTSTCESPPGQPAKMPPPHELASWLASVPADAEVTVVTRRTGYQLEEYDKAVGLLATWERPL